MPSTEPPITTSEVGGLFGLGFSENGFWANQTDSANETYSPLFSLSLSPQTADMSWYTGLETKEWPASSLEIGYNNTNYFNGKEVVTLTTGNSSFWFEIAGFGFNTSSTDSTFTNVTTGGNVTFDLTISGLTVTQAAYD